MENESINYIIDPNELTKGEIFVIFIFAVLSILLIGYGMKLAVKYVE